MGSAVGLAAVLLAYLWMPFYTFCYASYGPEDNERVFWATALNIVGVLLMIGADIHKYVQLKLKSGLISDGLFARTRNPNYLGEIMIYLPFAIISKSTVSYIVLFTMWGVVFSTSMLQKELSFMRKEGWETY